MSIPDEIVGKWIVDPTGRVVGHEPENQIQDLVQNRLIRLADREGGWTVLYRDQSDSSYWELTFPNSEWARWWTVEADPLGSVARSGIVSCTRFVIRAGMISVDDIKAQILLQIVSVGTTDPWNDYENGYQNALRELMEWIEKGQA